MNEKTVTLILRKAKETTNKIKFQTDQPPGVPPVLDDVYLAKWWAADCSTLEVTITKK